jgi:UDP-2-acetamido-3-amino-2,3-dideoxy-glucuronate N-acetyltransferase
MEKNFYVHSSSFIDEPCEIGDGTKIWHFCHIMKGAKIGRDCIFGQNCHVAENVVIGNGVKVQNNVSIYTGTIIEDYVFLGPSCVLTNVTNPRSEINRHSLYEKTLIKRGATIGANATVVCGITIGKYAFIAAGSVVTKDVPDYGLIVGVPGKLSGYMSRHGHRLKFDEDGIAICKESGFKYKLNGSEVKCMDWDEDIDLPESSRDGKILYNQK